MTHDVFVSYSSRDRSVAEAICAALEHRTISCWIAPRDVPPGAPWSESIVDAINASTVLLVVLSQAANSSHQVVREVERAVGQGLTVLPVRIEEFQAGKALQYYLGVPHWFDATPPPVERHLDALADSAARLIGMRATSPGPGEPARTEEGRRAAPSAVPEVTPDDWSRRRTSRRGVLGRLFEDH